jgi:hypothetical protein
MRQVGSSIPAAALHQALQVQCRGVARRVVGHGSGGGTSGVDLGCGPRRGGVGTGVPVWCAAWEGGGAGVHHVPGLVRRNQNHSSGEVVKKSAPTGKKSAPSPGWPERSTLPRPMRSQRFSYQLSDDGFQICLFVKQFT